MRTIYSGRTRQVGNYHIYQQNVLVAKRRSLQEALRFVNMNKGVFRIKLPGGTWYGESEKER